MTARGRQTDRMILGVLACIALVGCAERDAEAGSTSSVLASLPTWTAEFDLRIGSIDDPEQALTDLRVNLISEGPDGRLYIGQPVDGNVRVYDADGRLLTIFGGHGQGPGEFGMMMVSAGVVDDEVYVSDFGQADIEIFDREGRHLRTQTYRDPPAGETRAIAPQQLLPDGSGIASPGRDLSVEGEFVTLLLDASGALLDTLFSYSTRRVGIPLETGDRYADVLTPFGGPPPFIVEPAGEFVWTVDDEVDAEYRLTRVTVDGDTAFSRSFPVAPVPIPQAAIDSARAVAVERAEGVVGSSNEARALVDELVPFPTHYRAALGARLNRDGGIWIELPPDREEHHQVWVLHTETGDPKAVLEVPLDVEIALLSEEDLWAIERDEFDVPYLVRFRISKEE